jgi:hypothetical protein
VPASGQTGLFWFFTGANLELAVKVLDGTALNGHFWIFYAALTDLEYTVTVTDTVRGTQRAFHHPHGSVCGGADIKAFAD